MLDRRKALLLGTTTLAAGVTSLGYPIFAAVSGGTVNAPVLSLVRPLSASTTTFDTTSGGSIASNNLILHGTAPNNSTVTVYRNSVSQGQVTASGSGAWTFTFSGLADATHLLSATATVGGNTSPFSSTFSVTVIPTYTNLGVAFGQLIPDQTVGGNNAYFTTDGWCVFVQSDPNSPDAVIANDSHTMQYNSHYGDRGTAGWVTNHCVTRSAIPVLSGKGTQLTWNDGDVFHFTYETYPTIAAPVAGAAQWAFYETDATNTPRAMTFCIQQNDNHPYVVGAAQSGGTGNDYLFWSGTASQFASGVWHYFDVAIKIDQSGSTGYFHMYFDGVLILNLNNWQYPCSGMGLPYDWQPGIYRDDSNGLDQHVTHRNLLIRVNGVNGNGVGPGSGGA
jgi:hypothetical protein